MGIKPHHALASGPTASELDLRHSSVTISTGSSLPAQRTVLDIPEEDLALLRTQILGLEKKPTDVFKVPQVLLRIQVDHPLERRTANATEVLRVSREHDAVGLGTIQTLGLVPGPFKGTDLSEVLLALLHRRGQLLEFGEELLDLGIRRLRRAKRVALFLVVVAEIIVLVLVPGRRHWSVFVDK